ncbi:choice-of-anchor G family protein [Microbacterium sp. 179-I 3D3 NHS]|uniref:choice-of-anchor G family protein n=1 Tax=Microbacterium sp. 179-I 3D3 NHS TaxID=3142382 RepID=UPI0039A1A2A2
MIGRSRGRVLTALGLIVAASLVTQAAVASDATWNDSEWATGMIGTTSCADASGSFATRAEGRAVSGSLLGTDLDTLIEASGTTVTNDGDQVRYSPLGANPAGPDAFANPLRVVALSAVDVDLGNGLLQLPLDTATGLLGQYGRARSDGEAVGAGGFVTSSGGIATEPTNGYPELAALRLSTLLGSLDPGTAALLTDVTDVTLTTGAVAGRATIDGCDLAWQGAQADAQVLASALTREYVAADVATEVSSPAVARLVAGTTGIVDELNTLVAALAGDAGLLDGLVQGITGLLRPLLGTLRLGAVTVDSLAASVDLRPVTDLLRGSISDEAGIVRVDLGRGSIRVDSAGLVASAYGITDGTSLNGLAPNTDLLADPRILAALTDALTSALSEWLRDVEDALIDVLNSIRITLDASVRLRLLGLPVADITISVDAGLAALAAGGGVAVEAKLLGALDLGILDGLLNALTSGLGPVVANLVGGLLPTVGSLVDSLRPLISSLVGVVSNVYSVLYLSGVVSVIVNVQNDPLTGRPEPADWRHIPFGQYDVAALRISVLDSLGPAGVRLYLGRGSVGPGCSVPRADIECSAY